MVLTGGWTVEEQTFINGVLRASTPVFTANSDGSGLPPGCRPDQPVQRREVGKFEAPS